MRAGLAAGAAAAVALLASGLASGEPAGRGAHADRDEVASGLNQPIYVAAAPGVADLIYVVQRPGTVRALDPTDGSSQQFLDIQGRVSTAGEGGLLSIAFDPHYQSNGLFYAYYTTGGSHTIKIDEFEANSDTNADEGSRRTVKTIAHPGAENHQGGTVAFGPDNRLYAAIGDGGDAGDPDESAQDRGELTGKLLRINPHGNGDGDYSIPRSNPFVGRPGRDEIYALGLRNPFRFSFDEPTGRIEIGDVGQQKWEEVDIENERTLKGANFGWDHFEGDHVFRWGGDNEAPKPGDKPYEPPVHEYPHSEGNVITGGVIARDPNLPQLAGRYVYADFGSDKLRSFEVHLSGARQDARLDVEIQDPSSITAGPDKTIYVTSLTTGTLYRLVP